MKARGTITTEQRKKDQSKNAATGVSVCAGLCLSGRFTCKFRMRGPSANSA